MAVTYNPGIVTDGLVLCLDAANRKSYPGSGVTWNDISVQNNIGILTNGPSFSNLNNGLILLDGNDDVVLVNNSSSLQITGSLSISIWFYLNSGTNGNGIITKGPQNTDFDYMLYFTNTATTIGFYKKNSANTTASVEINVSSFVGMWTNIVATYNASNGRIILYRNSTAINSTNLSAPYDIRTSTNSLRIGQGWVTYTNGRISNVSIYNKALNNEEVLQNFNALRGRFGI
jgi:hypothetical protein